MGSSKIQRVSNAFNALLYVLSCFLAHSSDLFGEEFSNQISKDFSPIYDKIVDKFSELSKSHTDDKKS